MHIGIGDNVLPGFRGEVLVVRPDPTEGMRERAAQVLQFEIRTGFL
jgi:hypothetical protein